MTTPLPVWRRNFARRQSDVIDLVPVLPHAQNTVTIGARWSTGHAIIRDPVTGAYEERNPPMDGAALDMQSAILAGKRDNGWGWWVACALLLPAAYIFCRVMWP